MSRAAPVRGAASRGAGSNGQRRGRTPDGPASGGCRRLPTPAGRQPLRDDVAETRGVAHRPHFGFGHAPSDARPIAIATGRHQQRRRSSRAGATRRARRPRRPQVGRGRCSNGPRRGRAPHRRAPDGRRYRNPARSPRPSRARVAQRRRTMRPTRGRPRALAAPPTIRRLPERRRGTNGRSWPPGDTRRHTYPEVPTRPAARAPSRRCRRPRTSLAGRRPAERYGS